MELMGIVENLSDPQSNLLILTCAGQALHLGDEDVVITRPARIESRSIASVPSEFDVLAGQVVGECRDLVFATNEVQR
ncbi:hypothetical protein [Streptomyces hygroscopicus]|uniref:hypothetical protein n=1 Tax=Streptomyces hygroscopicus TaxID=1912 RepID=UPI001FCAA299|nr:hypothetical protein [Streptomyces hygroscopicus]